MTSFESDLFSDGRQSPAAADIQRGTSRLMHAHGNAVVSELGLSGGRRADIVVLSRTGDIWIVEIKSSLADFRADAKWPDYRAHCDRLYFSVNAQFPLEVIPEDAGLIVADRYGAEVLREAPEHRMVAARRKAVTLRFARAAALRLQGAIDPGLPADF